MDVLRNGDDKLDIGDWTTHKEKKTIHGFGSKKMDIWGEWAMSKMLLVCKKKKKNFPFIYCHNIVLV